MSESALIVVDMLNTYDHADAEPLAASVRERLPAMRSLIEAARERDVLTVYVNDNYGSCATRWPARRPSSSSRSCPRMTRRS